MGERLAKKILALHLQDEIDIVIPIPETSRTSALSCASMLQKPYREGFIKNRYIARTFIMPGQEMRRKTVRLKLNAIKTEFKDKNVLLVDDSIVRGTTSIELIQMAREAGAKRVIFASAAPAVRFSNVYGVDIPTRSELVAHNRSEEEIAAVLGADVVIYNDLDETVDAVRSLNPSTLEAFDTSCFDGTYVSEVSEEYLRGIEKGRGRNRKGSVEVDVGGSGSASGVFGDETDGGDLDSFATNSVPSRTSTPGLTGAPLAPFVAPSHVTFSTDGSDDSDDAVVDGFGRPAAGHESSRVAWKYAAATPRSGGSTPSSPSGRPVRIGAVTVLTQDLSTFPDMEEGVSAGMCESLHNGGV